MIRRDTIKKTAVSTLVLALLASGAVAMSGCAQVKQLLGQGEIGQSITTSRHVDDKDRANYVQVQDVDGNVFVTVAYLEQKDTTKFNVDLAKSELSKHNVNWYQMIASSSMGTQQRETCYLYFPSSVTLTEMQDVVNSLAENFNGRVLTQAEYDDYVNNVNQYDIYHNETTYFGPAAGK